MHWQDKSPCLSDVGLPVFDNVALPRAKRVPKVGLCHGLEGKAGQFKPGLAVVELRLDVVMPR